MVTPAVPTLSNEIDGEASRARMVSVIAAAVHGLGSPASPRVASLPLHVDPPPPLPRMKPVTLVLASILLGSALSAQSFNNLPVTSQKPPLHGRHWMAITGKPLAATAGAMIFQKGGNAVDAACAMLAATCTMFDNVGERDDGEDG